MADRPLAIDLFAGAGGMTLGFEQAGFDVVAAVDIDPIHCATHEYNFPFWNVVCRDLSEIGADELLREAEINGEDVDVIFGGPPCQGFSMIGKRSLDDPRNSLVFHFLRLIVGVRPNYFVMENVPGLAIGDHRKFLFEIIEALESDGYDVQRNFQVLNSSDFGVPQNRRRLFLFGARRGLELPTYPPPTTLPADVSNPSLFELPNGPKVWEAIGDLPEVERCKELLERDWTVAAYGKPSRYAKILRGLENDRNDLSYQREYNGDRITSSTRTTHTETSRRRFENTKHGETEPVSRFFKLDPDGLCNTLRAGTASNRGAFTSPRPIHPHTSRCITVREAARLHGYPDWFRFHVTKWHGFRQIGNSVPPLLARAVASEIIKVLGFSPSRPRSVRKLGDESLLKMNMTQAAKKYGVDPHIIPPRLRKDSKEVAIGR